jgi:hypothetical protein
MANSRQNHITRWAPSELSWLKKAIHDDHRVVCSIYRHSRQAGLRAER